MAENEVPMTFEVSKEHRALFRSIAKYLNTSMTDMIREFIEEQGKAITGPLTMVTVELDENGEEITRTMPVRLRAMEMSLVIENLIEQGKIKNEEALEKMRVRAEEKRKRRAKKL